MAQKPIYQATKESQNALEEMVKLAEIHSKLIGITLKFEVNVVGETAFISNIEEGLEERIEKLALEVDGIKDVIIQQTLPSKPGYINPFHNI